MLDFGLKRLRSAALQAAHKLAQPSDPNPQTHVAFDAENREIQIQFFVVTPIENLTSTVCLQKRQTALMETFLIGSTAYVVQLSDTQRVIRRLGAMFTHEPADSPTAVRAMGERIAHFKVTLRSTQNPAPIVCGGRLYDFR